MTSTPASRSVAAWPPLPAFPEALDEFLAVVATDKRHRDEAARKAMLTVFGLVGVRSELSDAYRRKLAIYL